VKLFFCGLEPCRLLVDASVSEKHVVSIFRIEDGNSMFLRKGDIAPEPRTASYLATSSTTNFFKEDFVPCSSDLKECKYVKSDVVASDAGW
jgi:hypothetical protein